MTGLKVVAEKEVADANQTQDPQAAHRAAQQKLATQMFALALKALSQKFIIAVSNLFTVLTAGSVFYLWFLAMDDMTVLKIVSLSIYAVFILALNRFGRRHESPS